LSRYEKESRGSNGANFGSADLDSVRIYVAGLIGVLLIVILALDLLGGEEESVARPSDGESVVLTEYDLLSRAGTVQPTPYWVGPRAGTDEFELERDSSGNVYVRYSAEGAGGGERRSESLTVATYPVAEAGQSLEKAARAEGREVTRGDGFALLASADSNSAYVVFDDQPELQVEIYSPLRGEAAALARALTPVHWTPLG
jgi:hypothetical protein